MTLFVDQLLLQLSDPARLIQVLAPAADPTRSRIRALIGAVYDMPFATIHAVSDVQVQSIESELPIPLPAKWSGTWQQTIPSYARSDISLDQQTSFSWVDLLVSLEVTVVLEVDPGEVESILTRDIGDFNTLDDFRARFSFIDLDAFMAKHRISTVEELKEAYRYLITEIRLKAPGPFDPNDPANAFRVPLKVVILLRDVLDLAAGLREAKVARLAAERLFAVRPELKSAEARTYCAPVLVFPESSLNGLPFDANAVEAFLATERVLGIFLTPS